VTGVDDADPPLDGSLVEGPDVPSIEGEHVVNPEAGQGGEGQIAGVAVCMLAHRPEPTPRRGRNS
jgi:hypothetical protein